MKQLLFLLRRCRCCFILNSNPTDRKEGTMGGEVGKGKLMETEEDGTKEEGISDRLPAVPS